SSGDPLPFPIRVSAGFFVIGLSGKMRIQTLPPRLMWRVSATRAASIWRAVTQPGSCACRPKVPNATVAPRVAIPDVRPLNILRNLTRFGASIGQSSPLRVGRVRLAAAIFHDLALEDPDLHTDGAEGGLRGADRVVDVRAQRMERHTALVVALDARDFGAAQAPAALHLDALGAHAHRALHRALHRAAERDALRQLRGDVVGDELRLDLRALDLLDVDPDFLAAQLLELVLQFLDRGALLADHHARTARVDGHDDLPRLAFDGDVGDRRAREARLQVLPEELIFLEQRRKVPLRVPLRAPLLRDAEAETDRIGFLSHYRPSFSPTMISMWLVRLRIGVARPIAAGMKRLSGGPSFTMAFFTNSASTSIDSFALRDACSAFATALLSTFSICFAACFLENLRSASASLTFMPRTWSITSRIL